MKLLLFILLFTFPIKEVKYINRTLVESEIPYNKNVKLKWNDFKIANLVDIVAQVVTGISYMYDSTKHKVTVNVYCVFYKQKAFVMKSAQSSYILNHEQRHFDITYIYSQEFIKRVNKSPLNSRDEVNIIYDKIVIEWNMFQNQYEEETKHSQDKLVQGIWNSRIDSLLNKHYN